jgi:hypothetical protein
VVPTGPWRSRAGTRERDRLPLAPGGYVRDGEGLGPTLVPGALCGAAGTAPAEATPACGWNPSDYADWAVVTLAAEFTPGA